MPARSRPRVICREVRVPAAADGSLRLAVVADTHGHPHADTARHLRAAAPDAILHAGDIGDPAVIDALAAIAPVHAVRGNIDPRGRFPDVLAIELAVSPAPVRLYLTHIAIAGVRLRADVAAAARAAGARLVVCGHSHVPFVRDDRGLAVLNPGSCGPRRFHLPIVFATLAITAGRLQLAHVDCETGARWLP